MPTTHKANRRARVVQVITVRIDATQLSDDEVAELKDFLDSDDHIASTAIDLPKVTIPTRLIGVVP